MKERLKAIRKEIKMTQQQFADALGMSRNFVYMMESGREPISDRTIKNICNMYRIREEWFRNGSGEMYEPQTKIDAAQQLADRLAKADPTLPWHKLMTLLAELEDDEIEAVYHFAERWVSEEFNQ